MTSIAAVCDELSRAMAAVCARYPTMRVIAAASAMTLHVSLED